MLDVLTMPATVGLPATQAFAATQLAPHLHVLESGTPEERMPIMQDLMRVVGSFNFENLDSGVNWPIYSALRTAATTRPDTPQKVVDAVRTGEEYLIEEYAKFYTDMAALFRLKLRPEFTMNEFSACMYAVNEGLANRAATNYRRRGIPLASGVDGAELDWSLSAVAFEALTARFFVPEEHADF